MKRMNILAILAITTILIVPAFASAQYNDSVNDSKGDVWYYQYTETKFRWKEGVERPDVDITEVSIEKSGDNIRVSIKVKGTISSTSEVQYQVYLEDNQENGYNLNFNAGECYIIAQNAYLSLPSTGSGTSTLEITFSLSEVGNPSSLEITEAYSHDWIDAEGEGEYYYDVAGPEATSPSGGSGDDGSGSSGEISEDVLDKLWAGSLLCIGLTIIVPVIIIILIVFLILKVIKSGEDKGQQPQQYQQKQYRDYQQPPPEEKQEKTPPPPEDQGGSKDTPPPPPEGD